jgi:fructose-1-phosphate kinase PfkB-like protein
VATWGRSPSRGACRLARLATAAGVPVLADVYGPALAALLRERPALVKVNGAEAGEAAGLTVAGATDALDAAGWIRDAGAGQVVVTLGRAGAVALDADGAAIQVPPPATLGRYPVGSGDAFLGGLAVGLVGGASLGGALRLASAAAAANAVMPGAGDLDPATLERLR